MDFHHQINICHFGDEKLSILYYHQKDKCRFGDGVYFWLINNEITDIINALR